jgi:hypothetical protein
MPYEKDPNAAKDEEPKDEPKEEPKGEPEPASDPVPEPPADDLPETAGEGPTDQLAVIGVVLGGVGVALTCVGIFCCTGLIGFPMNIAAIICALLSLDRMKKEPEKYGGRSLALIALGLAGAAAVIYIISWLVFILFLGGSVALKARHG